MSSFTPRIVVNEANPVSKATEELVSQLRMVKINKHTSGHWADLKLPDNRGLSILGPVCDVRRGASAEFTEFKDGEKKVKPVAPTLLIYLTKDAGSAAFGQLLSLIDSRVKSMAVESVKSLTDKPRDQVRRRRPLSASGESSSDRFCPRTPSGSRTSSTRGRLAPSTATTRSASRTARCLRRRRQTCGSA